MKILEVITIGHEVYGAQQHVLDLATAFHREGHEILVVVGSTGALTDALEERGLRWQQAPSLQRAIHPVRDLKACSELRKIIEQFQPDIVAAHSSKAGFVSRWVCHKLGIRNTFTAHGWSFEEGVPFVKRKIYQMVERATGLISDQIITVSQQGKKLGVAKKILPADRIHVIYNGAEDRGKNVTRRFDSEILTMVMVAGFRAQKDHTTLIHALARIKHEPWEVYFLGDGELQPAIESLTRHYGLEDKVHFAGVVNNVPDYLARSDVMLLITHWEGLPISIIEGLSFSLPVIASDVPGIDEQVVDGYNGILVGRGDVEDVQHAVEQLMQHRDRLEEFSGHSRKIFVENFTIDSMIDKTRSLYERMVNREI